MNPTITELAEVLIAVRRESREAFVTKEVPEGRLTEVVAGRRRLHGGVRRGLIGLGYAGVSAAA